MPPVYYKTGAFPPEERLDWPRLAPLIGPATAALARYDGVLASIPEPGVFLAPLSKQEAVMSSRIEGTQATLGEVLRFEAGQVPARPERRDDILEVLNYRDAMNRAEKALEKLPLSQRVMSEAHETLMSGVPRLWNFWNCSIFWVRTVSLTVIFHAKCLSRRFAGHLCHSKCLASQFPQKVTHKPGCRSPVGDKRGAFGGWCVSWR